MGGGLGFNHFKGDRNSGSDQPKPDLKDTVTNALNPQRPWDDKSKYSKLQHLIFTAVNAHGTNDDSLDNLIRYYLFGEHYYNAQGVSNLINAINEKLSDIDEDQPNNSSGAEAINEDQPNNSSGVNELPLKGIFNELYPDYTPLDKVIKNTALKYVSSSNEVKSGLDEWAKKVGLDTNSPIVNALVKLVECWCDLKSNETETAIQNVLNMFKSNFWVSPDHDYFTVLHERLLQDESFKHHIFKSQCKMLITAMNDLDYTRFFEVKKQVLNFKPADLKEGDVTKWVKACIWGVPAPDKVAKTNEDNVAKTNKVLDPGNELEITPLLGVLVNTIAPFNYHLHLVNATIILKVSYSILKSDDLLRYNKDINPNCTSAIVKWINSYVKGKVTGKTGPFKSPLKSILPRNFWPTPSGYWKTVVESVQKNKKFKKGVEGALNAFYAVLVSELLFYSYEIKFKRSNTKNLNGLNKAYEQLNNKFDLGDQNVVQTACTYFWEFCAINPNNLDMGKKDFLAQFYKDPKFQACVKDALNMILQEESAFKTMCEKIQKGRLKINKPRVKKPDKSAKSKAKNASAWKNIMGKLGLWENRTGVYKNDAGLWFEFCCGIKSGFGDIDGKELMAVVAEVAGVQVTDRPPQYTEEFKYYLKLAKEFYFFRKNLVEEQLLSTSSSNAEGASRPSPEFEKFKNEFVQHTAELHIIGNKIVDMLRSKTYFRSN